MLTMHLGTVLKNAECLLMASFTYSDSVNTRAVTDELRCIASQALSGKTLSTSQPSTYPLACTRHRQALRQSPPG